MVKLTNKKKQLSTANHVMEERKKLPRGYKECFNCKNLLNIHKYVCDQCGHKHDMKKKKVDILKNLNNMTPKLLKSLIELNDFNDISDFLPKEVIYTATLSHRPEFKIPLQYTRKKSSRKSTTMKEERNRLSFTQKKNYSYIKLGQRLTSICPVFEGVLIAQSIEKRTEYTQSEKITITAYKLQSFHKTAQIYKGKSSLIYLKEKRIQYRININQHIIQMKSMYNRVGLLTGKGTLIVTDLQIQSQCQEESIFQLQDYIEIKISKEDQITAFEWIRENDRAQECKIIVGTLMGHLYLYVVDKNTVRLERFISNAHFETVTTISQSPLNNSQECLFASGSYDGSISIWSILDKSPLFSMQASNRKITSIVWDPGAKFIFIIRDENQDSGVLICFFSVSKAEESVLLSDQIDSRLIRNSINCKIINDPKSNFFYLLDPYHLLIRIHEIQQLRKNSLKRKKIKKEQDEKIIEFDFPMKTHRIEQEMAMEDKSDEQLQLKMNEKYLPLPLIADGCQTRANEKDILWIISYDGYLFVIEVK